MLRARIPTHRLADHVNSYEMITCRKRTPDEEKAYMKAVQLPVEKPSPYDSVDLTKKDIDRIHRIMKRRGWSLARASHECDARVDQYKRSVKKLGGAK